MSMPTNKEKTRRRNISCSSESGINSGSSPVSHTPRDDPVDNLESEVAGLQIAECNVITLPCCNPRGCVFGPISSSPSETDTVIRMNCSNDKCPYSMYMHLECFDSFEEQVLSCLRGMSRAKNWSEKQRRQNLWTKKGYDLIYKFCSCRCSKGTLKKDLNHVIPNSSATGPSSTLTPPISSLISSSMSSSVTITQTSEKTKKKRKKSASFSERPPLVAQIPPRPRTRSHRNSDSVSSDNGNNYMQPFAHRTDYSIFDQLLPRCLVNSYHIKMEDDGYAAGDDTRSLVLSCLAYHHKSSISCVLCNNHMEVYDRFPLVNGTFFLSPIQSNMSSSLEVESKGDDPLYMSAVCVYCLSGHNQVYCIQCNALWNGKCHQIGTLYTYDIFASNPCCPSAVQCNSCKRALVEVSKISLSFTQLSSLYDCSVCGSKDYHFIRPMNHFAVGSRLVGTVSDQNFCKF